MTRESCDSLRLKLAYSCPVSWEEMEGTERTRFCKGCGLNVFNISELSGAQAERLIESHGGRLCVTYFQRQDGTVMTQDCPAGVRAARRALAGSIAALTAMLGVVIGILSIWSGRSDGARGPALQQVEPLAKICEKIAPSPKPTLAAQQIEMLRSLGYVSR